MYTWLGFNFDTEATSVANIEVPDAIQQLLDNNQFEAVYGQAFNVLTFATKENIEIHTLLEEACNKHLRKYFPDIFS